MPSDSVRRMLRAGLILLGLLPTTAGAAEFFESVGVYDGLWREFAPDARSEAMGYAYTAIAEGSAAVWWNPGALALPTNGLSLSFTHRDYILDLDQQSLSLAVEHDGFGLGMHASRIHNSIERTTVFRPEGDGTFFTYSLDLLMIGGAVDLIRLLGVPDAPVSLGMGTSWVHYESKLSDYVTTYDTMEFGSLFSWQALSPDRPEPGELAPAVEIRAGYAVENLWDRATIKRWDRGGLAVTVTGVHHSVLGPLVRIQGSIERRGLFLKPGSSWKPEDRRGVGLSLAGMAELRLGRTHEDSRDIGETRTYWGVGLGLKPGNPLVPRFGLTVDYAKTEVQVFSQSIEVYTVSGWFTF